MDLMSQVLRFDQTGQHACAMGLVRAPPSGGMMGA
jgi:hypothetical protein